ncbi:transglutaminase-like cysteine peptidase [Chelativorans intermedius]|uniref:Transglutaminase-like cysteine peptidase n=1 Tax=Chelativorans intermedius TaxID=515947 RepID=A0ABV6D6Y6_9HYPH|nr:transglutaminase-like cysteine peptidase [Chelativorans intermedius]MCT8999583.1 transglutaminase-like cysteine peptidase [Chelativorans intermedius]
MQRKRQVLLLAAAAMLAFQTGAVRAASDMMPVGGRASQPVGHYEFCQRQPSECRRTASHAPVEMTRALWAKLIEVNNSVNASIIPLTDMEMWGVEEHWSYPDLYGDCEDFVLEKRRLLIEAGIPAANLLITVVRQPNGDGHAVLTVNSTMGDFILDNLEPRILPWSQTEYQYLKRQSARHAGQWVSIHDGRSVLVGSISSNR